MTRRLRMAFTLVELLVVIAIIGVLVGLLLPAVQASREGARRVQCTQNMAQVVRALQGYESAQEALPAGTLDKQGPIRNVAQGQHISWVVEVLPYLQSRNVYNAIDIEKGAYAPENTDAQKVQVSTLICPSSGNWSVTNGCSYAGCHHEVEAPIDADNNGVLFLNSAIQLDDIWDGLSHTLFVGEKFPNESDLGWISGTRATLRNTGSPITTIAEVVAPPPEIVGGFGSMHLGGIALFAFGDGQVRSLADTINPAVFELLGNRKDGKLISGTELD